MSQYKGSGSSTDEFKVGSRKMAREDFDVLKNPLMVEQLNPIGFKTHYDRREALKYVVVPIEAVRTIALKEPSAQMRISQMPDDVIQGLEELVKAAKKAKEGRLSEEEELALAAVAW